MSIQPLLWKLLRRNVSAAQLAGFALASVVGLAIVMLAVQAYGDVSPLLADDDSPVGKDYLVITRSVTTAGALTGASTTFSEADIADLEAQPWCRGVGRFTGGNFGIYATVGIAGGRRAMHSQFFFESIPAQYVDTDSHEWTFDPARPEVPVIISRDYLTLYNFGFAATQGLPQVSEGQAAMIPITFTLSGNGRSDDLPGRIVGFSSRLNTVVVPEQFMQWAAARYGSGELPDPARLILEVSRPGDVKIDDYMHAHHFEVAGDKSSGRAGFLLAMATTVVVAVGAVISLLAFFVLMLSIFLLMQKNSRRLRDLLLLGYSPGQVARPYVLLVVALAIAVLAAATAVLLATRAAYLPTLGALGTAGSGVVAALATGMAIMALVTAGNIAAIRHRVATLWRNDPDNAR